jgi:ubiquinone/menaquinone biosynthesis C-methylase UbiE
MAASETNHWHDERCARAFWDQSKAIPYRELLADTGAWLDPRPGERWLDLGCGGGQLTAALWQQSGGAIGEITAMDCAAINAEAIDKLRRRLQPTPGPEHIRFVAGDFSAGLPGFANETFDGVVAGLSVCYAEARDPATGCYTDSAYNHLFEELSRILKPGGRLVFSSVVPNPRFWRIVWQSLGQVMRLSKPGRVLLNVLKMQRYGRWLRQQAQRGRFHFLPLQGIVTRLRHAGFGSWKCRLSYAGQAYIVRTGKADGPASEFWDQEPINSNQESGDRHPLHAVDF